MKRLILALSFCLVLFTSAYALEDEYSRSKFKHWVDINDDRMDARQEALFNQSIKILSVTQSTAYNDMIVLKHGFWVCPYTGKVFTDPRRMDADHIVPLKYAWERGANAWTDEKRELFANDQFNILMVDASTNRSKGASGPRHWIPPNLSYGIEYINRFMAVCEKYDIEYDREYLLSLIDDIEPHKKGIRPHKVEVIRDD